MCVCVFVCERDRERDAIMGGGGKGDRVGQTSRQSELNDSQKRLKLWTVHA